MMIRKRVGCGCIAALISATWLWGGEADSEPSLTVYNQNFAVVRERFTLDLNRGTNTVTFSDITAHLEPSSVVLRDLSGKQRLNILEQSYRADPVSEGLLLSLCEGKELDFIETRDQEERVVRGRVVRSGYTPHSLAMQRYGTAYAIRQQSLASGASGQPIVEVDGKLRFGLPGKPLFPELADDTVLKPTLNWVIHAEGGGKVASELCYVTGGLVWNADYNAIAPEKGGELDVIGWVTIDNQCGRSFEDARVKLMAGDVSKIQDPSAAYHARAAYSMVGSMDAGRAPVTSKAFDEYHLYTLARRTTLRDRETKQVEFVRAEGIASKSIYVYDGVKIDKRYNRGYTTVQQDRNYGTQCNPKVWVMREFENTKENHLGIPLPAGRVRFYRRDSDGQLEFTGEDQLDHTPRDEVVRVYTGNAFDVVGERRRTHFKMDHNARWLDESFELEVRNHKKEAVEVRIVEHLYRWTNWELTEKSNTFLKTDAQTIEFRIQVEPDGKQAVTYSVRYSW